MHEPHLHRHIQLFHLYLEREFSAFSCVLEETLFDTLPCNKDVLQPSSVRLPNVFQTLKEHCLISHFPISLFPFHYFRILGTYLFSIMSVTVCLAFLISPWSPTFPYWMAWILLSRSVMVRSIIACWWLGFRWSIIFSVSCCLICGNI